MEAEEWDARYASTDLLWGAGPNQFVAEQVDRLGLAAGRSLDLAAGEGRNSIWLAERGWAATAVDFSRVALERGRRLTAERGVEVDFVEGDVVTYRPAPGSYHLVLIAYLQVHPAERLAVLGNAVSGLAPGGVLLYIAHDRANLDGGYGGPQDPTVLPTAAEVAADLDGMVDVEEASVAGRKVETPEGTKVALDTLVRARRPD